MSKRLYRFICVSFFIVSVSFVTLMSATGCVMTNPLQVESDNPPSYGPDAEHSATHVEGLEMKRIVLDNGLSYDMPVDWDYDENTSSNSYLSYSDQTVDKTIDEGVEGVYYHDTVILVSPHGLSKKVKTEKEKETMALSSINFGDRKTTEVKKYSTGSNDQVSYWVGRTVVTDEESLDDIEGKDGWKNQAGWTCAVFSPEGDKLFLIEYMVYREQDPDFSYEDAMRIFSSFDYVDVVA